MHERGKTAYTFLIEGFFILVLMVSSTITTSIIKSTGTAEKQEDEVAD